MKTSVGRLLTGVVALALLLGGFGLMQSTAQAQTVAPSHICSNDSAGCSIVKFGDHDGDGGENDMYYTGTAPDGTTTTPSADDHNNVFTFTHTEGGTLVVQNLDLPTVRHKVEAVGGDATDPDDDIDGANANPKSIAFTSGTITFVAVHRSSGLTDDGTTYQVKAFNGNTIRVSFTPTGGGTFATIKTVMVDNGKPALVATSPDPGLIVKGNVDITFSADITDSGAGFDAKYGSATAEPPTGIAADLSPDGLLTAANNTTNAGGVRLVVAGNVVELPESAFTKIDDGWRVTATINSTSLQGIATNVPWYFEVRDRANNVQRTTGSVSGTAGADSEDGTIVDSTFSGTLNTGTFLGTMIRVMKKDGATTVTSKPRAVTFVGTNGVFTIPGTSAVATALFPDAVADDEDSNTINDAGYQCRFDERDAYLADNSDLDATQPDGGVNGVADSDNNAAQLMACQPAEGDKYEILGTNLITIDSVAPTLASDNPVVTGRGYDATNKDKAQRNSIRVRFVDIGKTDSTAPGSGIDAGTVTAGAFTVSGHTVEGVQSVGNAVYLALADNLGSTEQPTVDIAGAVIMDKAGNAVSATRQKAADNQGPVLSLSESEDLSRDKVTVTITTDEQLNDTPMVYVTKAAKNGDAAIGDTAASPVSQTGALSYSYAHQQSVAGDGLYSVYVEAEDVGDTMSTVGNKGSASKPSSFTFQLDRRFNGGVSPEVTASSAENVEAALTPPKVETISPMIITVDFAGEAGEYDRDSYKKVTLTSATLKIAFSDGTSDPTRTFDLATEVSSPDSIKYTIPLLNPKLGTYTLTVKGEDSAGNASPAAGYSVSWEVIAASPVDIDLQPGWNLISLPFQPANPAINSVIPNDHPIGLVMTFYGAEGVWLFSRRDAETGMFAGDVAVMTAASAYFVNTDSFVPLKLLRPPLATAAAAPAQPPAITVSKGWNLVPVSTNDTSVEGIDADTYFGTLGATWLRALAWDSLTRSWIAVSPNGKDTEVDPNPIAGRTFTPASEDPVVEESTSEALSDDDRCGRTHTNDAVATSQNANALTVGAQVCVGEGLWLWVTEDGTLIPGG